MTTEPNDVERMKELIQMTKRTSLNVASISDIALRIDQQVAANESAQIPEVVFERLLDLLVARVPDADPAELIAKLERFPPESFTRQRLLAAARLNLLEGLIAIPDNEITPTMLLRRARYRADHAHWDEALADALRLDPPRNLDAAVIAVRSLIGLSRATDALQLLTKALAEHPEDEYFLRERSQLYYDFHYCALAWEDARRLSESDSIESRLFAATIALATGHHAEAATIAADERLSLERLPILARAELRRGHDVEAAAAAMEYVETTASDPSLTAYHNRLEALTVAAIAYMHSGRYDIARRCCLEAWALGAGGYELRRAYVLAAESASIDQTERTLLRDVVNSSGSSTAIERFFDHLATDDPRVALRTSIESAEAGLGEAVERWIEPSMEAEFYRGFPTRVRVINMDRIPMIERLPWPEVVQELSIAETEPTNPAAFTSLFAHDLPALRALEIRSVGFDYSAAIDLTCSAGYARIESLRLLQCNLDVPAIDAIVTTLQPTIRELRIAYANGRRKLPLKPTVGESFHTAAGLTNLELLDVTDCALNASDVTAILTSNMPNLHHLVLTGNDMRGMEPTEFVDLPLLRQLRTLVLGDTNVERELIHTILDRLPDLSLERIVAPGPWSTSGIDDLMAHPNFATIDITVDDPQSAGNRLLEILDLDNGHK